MTVIYIAALLLVYKAIVFWMKHQEVSLQEHNRKLRESFREKNDIKSD